MRLCWKPVSRRLSLTWSFCSRDIHLPPIWRAGGEGCFIICFASLDVFRHQAKGNNQAYVVFESNKHNISCYCILMWFFIDPCRKTLVFLALQTRARRLEVSCLLGLWFVKTSQLEADRPPRPARKPPSCPDFPVHRVFTLLRGGSSKKSQSLHTCKSLTQRGVCTFKMTTTEQHFFFWVAERRKSKCSAAPASQELSVWRMSAGPPLHTTTNNLQNKNGSFSF